MKSVLYERSRSLLLSSIQLKGMSIFCPLGYWNILGSTLKIFNFAGIKFTIFAIFDHFREILYPRKVSKPQSRKIKYMPSLRFSFS